jgi:peptidoglycan/xylan/chitin deacetylase (PgdA/CDA1 family)
MVLPPKSLQSLFPGSTLALAFLLLSATLGGQSLISQSTVTPQAPSPKSVALTFDDLPYVEVGGGEVAHDLNEARATTWRLLDQLAGSNIPAIGFVNERKLHVTGEEDARIALLERWLKAGKTLGNHTYSHLDLQTTPLPQFEDDVVRGEVVTRRLMAARGLELRYFRHPYTHTGPTREVRQAFESFLHERGYIVTPHTVENADYMFNVPYVLARRKQDAAEERHVRDAYLEYNDAMFRYFEAQSQKVFGRDVPQVLLIHANDLNADAMGEVMKRLKQRGYRFVSLDEAMRDPAYQTPDLYVGSNGISWMHRWKLAKGIAMDMRDEPDPPKWVQDSWRALQR